MAERFTVRVDDNDSVTAIRYAPVSRVAPVLVLAHGAGVADLIEACLRPPLYATRFHHGFGTLYTAEYRPADGIVRYHWPQRRWEQSLDNIKTDSIQLQLGTP
jgi:hypothetical protein